MPLSHLTLPTGGSAKTGGRPAGSTQGCDADMGTNLHGAQAASLTAHGCRTENSDSDPSLGSVHTDLTAP